jgi:hypothetical protein
VQAAERATWRTDAQKRMDGEALVACSEVGRRPQGIRADQHASLRPPERDLPPRSTLPHGQELEGRDRLQRYGVMRNAEAARKERTVPIVAVEQLKDAGRVACRAHSLLDAVAGEGVDQPDAPARDERVRTAFHELVDDPAEADLEFVAEPDLHGSESTGTP